MNHPKQKVVDHYAILGVSKDADDATIKKAYRKLALKYHPDKHSSADESAKKAASDMFAKVSNAYEVLSDPEERRKHDIRSGNYNSSTNTNGVPYYPAAGTGNTAPKTTTTWTTTSSPQRTTTRTTTSVPTTKTGTKTTYYYSTPEPTTTSTKTTQSPRSPTKTTTKKKKKKNSTKLNDDGVDGRGATCTRSATPRMPHSANASIDDDDDDTNNPVMSMSSSTRTVLHSKNGQSFVETITEKTVTRADGSTQTSRSSKMEPSASNNNTSSSSTRPNASTIQPKMMSSSIPATTRMVSSSKPSMRTTTQRVHRVVRG